MSRRGRVGGSGGNARVRQREDDNVPIPPQIDVTGSWKTWDKLSARGGEGKHLVNDMWSDSFQKYKFCGSTRELREVYERIAVNPRIQYYIGLTNWEYMASAKLARTDHMLVYALLERWWPSTHTFHLPMMELGFTPYDFTCITGVTVGLGLLRGTKLQMGSLVGGWDSPAIDPKTVKYQRNKSLTNEYIEAYWNSKKPEDDISSSPDHTPMYQRSSSLPDNTKTNLEDIITDPTSFESLMRQQLAWWTLSNSAFLNEDPVIIPPEGSPTNKIAK